MLRGALNELFQERDTSWGVCCTAGSALGTLFAADEDASASFKAGSAPAEDPVAASRSRASRKAATRSFACLLERAPRIEYSEWGST